MEQAAKDLEQSLLLTLRRSSLPPKPGALIARKDPFWYRSMYMLAILAEEPGRQKGARKEWTMQNIGFTLAITLEEQLASLPRWLPNPPQRELSIFLETVEPEILVLVAGTMTGRSGPLTMPRDASDRKDLGRRPSHDVLVDKLRGLTDAKQNVDPVDVARFMIGYVVRYLEMTPRGNYNLACYCSDGAKRAPRANRARWIEAAEGYLFDGLSGLDRGMDAWARVDKDLDPLRDTNPSAFESLVQRAAAVRTARYTGPGSTEATKPSAPARQT